MSIVFKTKAQMPSGAFRPVRTLVPSEPDSEIKGMRFEAPLEADAEFYTSSDIARSAGVSVESAKYHMRNLFPSRDAGWYRLTHAQAERAVKYILKAKYRARERATAARMRAEMGLAPDSDVVALAANSAAKTKLPPKKSTP